MGTPEARKIIGPVVEWKSSVCSCRAVEVMGEDPAYEYCSPECIPWTEKIAPAGLAERKAGVEKARRRGIPKSFAHIIERYGKGDGSFHRPPEVRFNPEAVDAEFGLYIKESLGVDLASCSDPTRYAHYLSGKASQGLSEKMWLEDYYGRVDDARLFLPEEFVVNGDVDFATAEALFGRRMRGDLLWLAGWDEGN